MKNHKLKKFILSAMFMGLGLVLPFLTGQVQQIGNMLLPMHIPVMLCGLICGPVHGLLIGFSLPLIRSLIFTMPVMYPNAIAMAFELLVYGFVSGGTYSFMKPGKLTSIYISLIVSMIAGRIVWGISEVILLGIKDQAFTFNAFIVGGFINAIPGIILQLILIPAIVVALHKSAFSGFSKNNQ